MNGSSPVLLLLGSNIRKDYYVPSALCELQKWVRVQEISALYESEAVGVQNQPRFYNVAVLIDTELSPHVLKEKILSSVEMKLGRNRTHDSYAPRTIDIDLVMYRDVILPDLGLPSADLTQFAHAAIPCAEIAGNGIHPVEQIPLSEIAKRFDRSAFHGIYYHCNVPV